MCCGTTYNNPENHCLFNIIEHLTYLPDSKL